MRLKNFLRKAQRGKWAIGQFNFSNLETLKAIITIAKKKKSPVILGTSEGESRFFGLEEAGAIAKVFKKEGVPAFLNLDHGHSFSYIKKAIQAGYDAVHFDGSKLPLAKNIKEAKKIVAYAHRRRVLVEGEINFVKGSSRVLKKAPKIREQDLTDPQEAKKFVAETGVDSLAVNIGTFHGVDFSGKIPNINLERLDEIRKELGNVFLVLHGGSGVAPSQIKRAVRKGIVKININTELRVAYKEAMQKTLKNHPKEVKPYRILPPVVEAVSKIVKDKIELFGSQKRT